ncbi:MAG: thermonuclease family protein [Planctomycetes bacterium]|nr:thermonuclease family protein [Planctomycetota bacterium]
MRKAALFGCVFLLTVPVAAHQSWWHGRIQAPVSGGKQPAESAGQAKVVKERIAGDYRHPDEKLLRITGKVKVIDASVLSFDDGTQVDVSGMTDAPALEQKALIADRFYPCGKDAAQFLEKLIGGRLVTFYAFGDGGDRDPKRLRGRCFVGETDLGSELVRNGWALSHHSAMTPYEIIARESKRGLWRGPFIIPERWRKGERLPGE